MKPICCTMCGEDLTAPVFIEGKPYGWSCASKVSSNIRKSKIKQNWVVADSFEFNYKEPNKVLGVYEGKKYVSYMFKTTQKSKEILLDLNNCFQFDGIDLYIDLCKFKTK